MNSIDIGLDDLDCHQLCSNSQTSQLCQKCAYGMAKFIHNMEYTLSHGSISLSEAYQFQAEAISTYWDFVLFWRAIKGKMACCPQIGCLIGDFQFLEQALFVGARLKMVKEFYH